MVTRNRGGHRRRSMKPFECTMCGECCKGKGGVYVTEQELLDIARFLGLEKEECESKYCVLKNGRIYIRTREDGYCIAWDNGCTIHPVKPEPCRQWPFFDAMFQDRANWEVAKRNCPGVNPSCTYEEFLEQGRLERGMTVGSDSTAPGRIPGRHRGSE